MKNLKILFIGNSFAQDTMEHTPSIARVLGIESIKFGLLYVGGCSIDMHYAHAMGNLDVYKYYTSSGDAWHCQPDFRISDALSSEDWDWVAIQHGTHGRSRYTSPECYERLTPLIEYVKERVPAHTKIAFNLTWMGEATHQHHEIVSYHGDTAEMRRRLIEVTRATVAVNPLVDLLIPTGTAIENARTSRIGLLTRDCYHLSMDKGRFIAGLTFLAAITGLSIDNISSAPVGGVDEYALAVAIESVKNALKSPFEITPSAL